VIRRSAGPFATSAFGAAALRAARNARAVLGLVAVGAVAALAGSSCNAQPSPLWVRSAACGFVDERGESVVLRGFNMIAPNAPAVWAKAVSLGANFVRIPIAWSEVEPTGPDGGHRWNARLLAALDREMRYFQRRHVVVLLDFHQFRWSPYFDAQAEGIPGWFYEQRAYRRTHAGKQRALADWWTDADGLRAYSAFVAMMVQRYRSFPNLLGYELFNEPATGLLGDDHAATQAVLSWEARVREVITALDASRTVFVQTRGGGDLGLEQADFRVFGSLENLAVDLHSYFSGVDGTGYGADGERWVPSYERAHLHGTPAYAGSERNQEALLGVALAKTRALGIPLLVGEWGARTDDPNADLYQAQMLRIFRRHAVSWARWDLSPNPTFGLLHPVAGRRGLVAQIRHALAEPVRGPPTCAG
jgi:hypothetical protein